MNTQHDQTYPTLILVRGLPGSGKSYITNELQKHLPEPAVILDPDATDYESARYAEHVKQQEADGVDPRLHAYRFLRAQAHEGIAAHKVIIWNQPFTNLEIFNKMVANLRAHAAEYDTHLPILVVEVEIDHDAAKERVQQRKQAGGHGPSEDTFARFTRDYKSFAPEGYTTVSVDGSSDVSVSVSSILKALEDLWSAQK